MEAVPRLPMVCFELRTQSETTNFGPKLKEYIRDFYNEDPETYSHEINQLDSLRAAAVRPGRDVSGVANLKRYYCQLHFLMSRFPMTKDGAAAVQFSWRDTYVGVSFSVADIRYEISSILYNIGALHTQLGMSDTRTTEDGMKMACTHFQCAAWAFQHLKDSYPPSSEADIAPDIMQFAYHLCLAQAQECILEKSMMDNRKASIIVKVAVQVVNYYSQAFNALKQSVSEEAVGTKVYTSWRRLAKFKEIYYRCVIQLFQGMQAEEQQKMGERVAFYQLAHDTLEEAIKLSKNLDKGEMNPKQVQESLSFTQDVVEGKRKAAKNENEFIYHEEVPDRDQLPKAMGVSLVKGIPFSINDSEVSGPDIFGRLVPMKAHEASSLYSEEKAKLLRKVGGSIEEKDQLLTAFLSSLQLDYLHCYSEPNQLPQELVDRCAALSAKPNAIQSLTESMSKLSEVCTEVETMLQEIKTMLQEEEILERDYQAIMGKRPPSIVATDLTREATKYQEAHARANESNEALHKVMSTHISNLRILSLPLSQLQQQIPPPPTLSDADSGKIVREMQNLMEKVEEMRSQRSMLTSQLRDSICKDDITQRLVTNQNENVDNLFQDELKKHQDIVKLIQQNLTAQDNILKAVTDAYARYSNVRKATAEVVRKRQSVINALISCFDAYEDLLAKSAKGHEFYNILETNVSKLLGRVKSTCRVQQEEREQMLIKNNTVLPSKTPRKGANTPDVPGNFSKTTSAPKLKDFLNADGGLNRANNTFLNSEAVPSAYSAAGLYGQIPVVSSSSYYDSTVGATSGLSKVPVDGKPQNWMPGVRPAPLGSEATSSVIKSEPHDMTSVPYAAQAPTVPAYSQQVYNYAGMWGYGSQAATMSTYLPTNVQYSVDMKPSDMQVVQPAHQLTTYNTDQGHRYTPVGGASYQSGSNESLGSLNTVPQANTLSILESAKSATSPVNHMQGNIIPTSSYQYEAYHPAVGAASGHQYNAHSVPANFQNSTYYENTAASVPSGYQNVGDQTVPPAYSSMSAAVPGTGINQYLNQPSEQPGNSVYLSGAIQNTSLNHQYSSQPSDQVATSSTAYNSIAGVAQSTNSNPYANHFAQTPDAYGQQALANYQNINNPSATAASQGNVYSYDQHYQGSWPASAQSPLSADPAYAGYQMPGSSNSFQYQYNQNSSLYSSAGSYPTNQTSSSYSSHVQSYGYNSSTASATGNYYQVPPYGALNNNSEAAVESESFTTGQQDYNSQGMYMQARMPKSDSYTTNSPQASRSSHTENASSSNVDLLAGLDFSINQQPLVPESGKITPHSVKESISSFPSSTGGSLERNDQEQNLISANHGPDTSTDTLVESMSILQIPTEQTSKTPNPKLPVKDPFQDQDYLNQFTQDVEKYEKFVEGLTLKTLNGPTPLDIKWKEINELQEKDSHRRSISVARCYPMKNRFSDILPYDCSRIELPSTKDDYINASHMKDLTPSTPSFILTQLPLPSTFNDFWIMVYEQQVEVIVCLLSDFELEGQCYWPVEKNQEMSVGRMRLSLQTANIKQHWTERIISVSDAETRVSRIVVHFQFTAWPGSSFPASPGPFLSFVSECLTFYSQQRVASHPLVVHCLSGVGRTGLFCLTAAAICEVQAGRGLIDIVKLTAAMSERRKAALRDREHLKFAYLSVLYYAQDILMKCGILTSGSSFEDKRSRSDGKCHTRHPSQDFLLGPPTGLSQLQSGIEKMGLGVQNQSDSNGTKEFQNEAILSLMSTEKAELTPNSHLTDLSLLNKGNASKESKSSAENFKKASQEHLSKHESNSTDPFSEIDPLWPLKRS
ncbi:tyrosine-protein phosphatase non-receptor type 23 isoform X1 [Frankliniella occidentalis]|uniref:Tyrosine-protein phosphatase non-receptor type 23 isoform X1 n=1 Tax=Frankliniella occidentalis TaxID=133901 RepID=A0A6J1TCD9_FRAOC|nr:tyrosine-protein phosphatase non-receptor type 23 isoform X1 [Frankliniella occidentalis]